VVIRKVTFGYMTSTCVELTGQCRWYPFE
jgi:hypothetical protein